MKTIDKLYALFVRVAKSLQSPFLLFVRVYWGWWLAEAGWGKLTHIPKTTEYFTQVGVPAPAFTAHFVGGVECLGGCLIILGLASRLISVPLIINMFTAFYIADRDALKSIFSEPDKFYGAAPYTFLFAFIIILLFGPGLFSFDALIAKVRAKSAAP